VQNAWAEQKVIGLGLFEAICGPLTDRNAVLYRAMLFWLMQHIAASAATIATDLKESHLETVNIIRGVIHRPGRARLFCDGTDCPQVAQHHRPLRDSERTGPSVRPG